MGVEAADTTQYESHHLIAKKMPAPSASGVTCARPHR